jgi:hypothetical protein
MNQFITFMMSYLYLPIEIITRIQGIWDRGCVFENLLEPWKCTPPEFENNRKETNCLSPHRIEGLRSPTRWLHILSQPFSRCYSFLITTPPCPTFISLSISHSDVRSTNPNGTAPQILPGSAAPAAQQRPNSGSISCGRQRLLLQVRAELSSPPSSSKESSSFLL